jgi:Tol biopolymer transport system component
MRMRLTAVTVGLATMGFCWIAPVAAQASPARGTARAVTIASSEANGSSWAPATSADGRWIAFSSDASDLLHGDSSNDPNGFTDVFLADTQTGDVTLVSAGIGDAPADGPSGLPDISADGRYVVFETTATNVVPSDANGATSDVVRFDATTGDIVLVSRRGIAGVQGDGASFGPTISADGTLVAFTSQATNLVGSDTNKKTDAFVRNVDAGTTTRVSTDTLGRQSNGPTYEAVLAPGGGFIAFSSLAKNLVSGDTNADRDVFLKNLSTGKTLRASIRTDGKQANGDSSVEDVSSNGRWVVFSSFATNLSKNDANNRGDVFMRDRVDATTIRVSKDGPTEGNDDSYGGSISDDGAYITFLSRATNLTDDADTNGVASDLFEYTVATKLIVRLSNDTVGGGTDAGSYDAVLSGDGVSVAFASIATDLVGSDTNGADDVFRQEWTDVDRTQSQITRVSEPSAPAA